VMVHLSDGEAWNALDNFDPDFVMDVRNVHIGLAIDDFTPFTESVTSYSRWSVFAISYNLSLVLCRKYEHMFFCLIVPGPDNSGSQLNVMMQPLIEELKQLWIGVEAYNCHKKRNSTSRWHTCGQFMISWPMVFSLDGAFMKIDLSHMRQGYRLFSS
jgi:hypothetical protein